MAGSGHDKAKWMVLDGDGKQKHVSGSLKPQELVAKLKKGNHSWDSKLYPVVREEYGGLCVLECKECKQPLSANNPSKSFKDHTCKPHNLAKAVAMRASPPASPTTRGAARRMREEDEGAQAMGSSMTPPKRARESTLDSFTVRPVQLEQVHRMLSAHVTTAAAERNWSAWARTYTSLRNALSKETAEKLVYTKANMPASWYSPAATGAAATAAVAE